VERLHFLVAPFCYSQEFDSVSAIDQGDASPIPVTRRYRCETDRPFLSV
jgi:hypothetical protein